MSEYEKVHFDNWQNLAKAVIDGGEFYYEGVLITCTFGEFNFYLGRPLLERVCIRKK